MLPSSASTRGQMNFGTDLAYQAALAAAARSSVLAASFGLPASLGQSPAPHLADQQQQISSYAAPQPGTSSTREKSNAPGAGIHDGKDAPTAGTSPPADKSSGLSAGRSQGGRGATGTGQQSATGRSGRSAACTPSRAASGGVGNGQTSTDTVSELTAAEAELAKTRLGAAAKERAGKQAPRKDGQWFGAYHEHLGTPELSQGLKSGRLFRGKIRINPGNTAESYVTLPGLPHDLLIRGELSRNRAVEGDEVAVRVTNPADWFIRRKGAQQQQAVDNQERLGTWAADECPWHAATSPEQAKQVMAELLAARPELRATGKVVGVLTPSPKREQLVGLLRLSGRLPDPRLPAWDPASGEPMPRPLAAVVEAVLGADRGEDSELGRGAGIPLQLVPVDPRLPSCSVRAATVHNMSPALLAGLLRGDEAASRTLVSGLITSWPISSQQPLATLRASLGQAGEIESETAAILTAEGIRCDEFSRDVLDCLPAVPWRISEQELAGRRDFRSQRVFSIDPPTAKDLDDALSIEPLPGGYGWRVGVHIADVSYFIKPFSALDVEAGRRATSTYLVQRVVPMLPPLLCEQLCSLNPGEERLTFSVVWDMGHDGSILSTWFGRSVIRSCAKLSYPLVQRMIEGDFRPEDTGVPLHGEGVTWEQVVSDSLALWGVARQLREARFRGGALRLDNTRLFFTLDQDGNPVGSAPYVQKEANQLVEEFMVAANISVAQLISEVFPERSLLRRHPPPNGSKMRELQDAAAAVGVSLDVSSAASLQATLAALRASAPPDPAEGEEAPEGPVEGLLSPAARHRRRVELLVMLATRPMQLALYFSTATYEGAQALWRHYALAVGHYTHFTSPIRRYPDVVVHRQLAAALDVQQGGLTPEQAVKKHCLLSPELTARVADHCNDRRLAARDAQDASLRLYLSVLLSRQPQLTLGIVNSLGGDLYFSAYLSEFGTEVQVRLEDAGVPMTAEWNEGAKVLSLTRGSSAEPCGATVGRKRHGQRQGGSGRGQGHGQAGGSVPSLEEWVQSLPPIRNPHGLQPASLPLHVRQFDDVPLIVTAVLTAGEPPRLAARMYLPEAERAEEAKRARGEQAAGSGSGSGPGDALPQAAESGVLQSLVPWDNMLVD